MAEYSYSGVDKKGQTVSGTIDASTEADLRMALRDRGIRPVKISRRAAAAGKLARATGGAVLNVPVQIVALFSRQLQLLISSGVPLLQALSILHEQSGHSGFKTVLHGIKENVSKGGYFWESLQPYSKIFPKIYVALVRAGESSGSLDQMLKRITKYLEDAERMRRMVKGAMMYPIMVISVGIGVIAAMMIFVIPKFEELLTSSGQELPGVTKFVIDTSHFMASNALYLAGGIFLGVTLLKKYFGTTEGKAVLDRFVFKLPVFGGIAQKAAVSRFCRTFQTLLTAGVNIVDAIDICRATIDNVVIEEVIAKVRGEVEAGKTVGAVLNKYHVFPKMAVQMIMVGESTGNMDQMLEKIAEFYDEEVEVMVASSSKLIEPLVLVFLGGAVGGLMIAMYLPIFKLAGGAVE